MSQDLRRAAEAAPKGAAAPATGARAAETAARRHRILEAAMTLAGEGGYDAVQMRDVAARSGVALGTLYRHYASKDQLLLAALADQAGALSARLALRPPAGADPAERVADVLRRASRALGREPKLTAAMVTALSSREPDAAAMKEEVNEILRTIIAGAIDGTDVPELDGVLRVLGYVWFAVLAAWVSEMLDTTQMGTELASAAQLLLERDDSSQQRVSAAEA
ncbi:MAG TPA: TetR family transcriptional regulator [Acidimicrobiia bacterium]|jgi:AcrR family transcriptional regulator